MIFSLKRISCRRTSIIILYGVLFSAIRMLTGSFATIYTLNKGIDIEIFALSKSYQLVLLILLDIVAGILSEKIGYYKTIILSSFFSTLYLICMFYLNSVVFLFLGETFNAFSIVLFNGAFEILLKYMAEFEQVSIFKVLGKFNKMQLFGILVASIVGSLFADSIGENNAWLISAILMFVLHCVYSFFISTEEIINKEKDLKSNLCLRELFDTLKCAVGVRKYAIVAIILMSIRNFLLTFWQPIIFGSLSGSNILFEVVYIIILWIQIIASTLVEKEKNNIWTLLIRGVLIGGILFCFSPYKCSELIIVLFLFFVIRFYSIKATCKIVSLLEGGGQVTSYSIISAMTTIMGIAVNLLGSKVLSDFSNKNLLLGLSIVVVICVGYFKRWEQRDE